MRWIFSSHNLQLVHHARNVLEAAGIRAVVKNEYLGSAMGELPPAECEIELWVLNECDAERARGLLDVSTSGPDWRCACGEVLGAQFSVCWRCGAPRPA